MTAKKDNSRKSREFVMPGSALLRSPKSCVFITPHVIGTESRYSNEHTPTPYLKSKIQYSSWKPVLYYTVHSDLVSRLFQYSNLPLMFMSTNLSVKSGSRENILHRLRSHCRSILTIHPQSRYRHLISSFNVQSRTSSRLQLSMFTNTT